MLPSGNTITKDNRIYRVPQAASERTSGGEQDFVRASRTVHFAKAERRGNLQLWPVEFHLPLFSSLVFFLPPFPSLSRNQLRHRNPAHDPSQPLPMETTTPPPQTRGEEILEEMEHPVQKTGKRRRLSRTSTGTTTDG
jgi:hypothetical protein